MIFLVLMYCLLLYTAIALSGMVTREKEIKNYWLLKFFTPNFNRFEALLLF